MKKEVIVVLPDIHSGHNVGSFLRAADGAGVTKVFLTGFTPTPEHPHVLKVSLGSEESVAWEKNEDTLSVLHELKEAGYQLVAIERTADSQTYTSAPYAEKVVLIFGNERTGVPQEILQLCDMTVDIPMRGIKDSLNVSIAGGIMLYEVLRDEKM